MKKVARNTLIRKDAVSGNVWVGVDVHKNSYAVTILDENGRDMNFTMPADPLTFAKKLILTGCVVKQVVYGECNINCVNQVFSTPNSFVAFPENKWIIEPLF